METRSRYGRIIKKPNLYEPQEVCEDDYSDSDYDETIIIEKKTKKKKLNNRTINLEEDSDGETIGSESESESEEDLSDSEADDEGNLKGFVCYSDSEEEEEEEDTE